jgi:uncharacterized protein (TIGR00730 family)
MIRSIAVYCSSSTNVADIYMRAGAELGYAIARAGWTLVYGGNNVGLMGVLADAVRESGGKVIGVTPKLFCDKGVDDKLCDELIISDGMRDRKQIIEQRGDAFIALPGGLGTFEEIFDIICSKQLGYHNKPVVLLNINDYYEPLLAMMSQGIEQKFITPSALKLWHVAPSVRETIDYIRSYTPAPPSTEWVRKGLSSAAE